MSASLDDVLNLLANAIVTARDFCGDEKQAFIDMCADLNYRPTVRLYQAALERADRIWNECRKQAGVTKPVGTEERIRIYRMMEEAD